MFKIPKLLLFSFALFLSFSQFSCASDNTNTVEVLNPSTNKTPNKPSNATEPSSKTVNKDDTKMYFEREITKDDLSNRTLRELNLLRNTIFARAGNPFRKKWLNDYFSTQNWYKPLDKIDDSKVSALDKKNAAFIAKFETEIPKEELRTKLNALEVKPEGELTPEDRIERSLLARALGEIVPEDSSTKANPLDNPSLLEKLITLEQLSDYSRRDLRILRNMVYARHGRTFKSFVLQEYFDRMQWYKPNESYNDDLLTEVDRKNINIIRSLEDQLGGPMTEYEQMGEDGWFGAF